MGTAIQEKAELSPYLRVLSIPRAEYFTKGQYELTQHVKASDEAFAAVRQFLPGQEVVKPPSPSTSTTL